MLVMERAHKRTVLNEIENSCIILQDDFDLSARNTAGNRGKRSKTVVGAKRFNRKHSAFINSQPSESDGGGEHLDTKSSRSSSNLRNRDAWNYGATAMTSMRENCDLLNHGWLYKTSRGKITSDLTRSQHENRQYRRFQLTEHSLEYSQLLQRVAMLAQ